MLSAEGERFLAMDQPLQYAFEGYDSSPPPTYFFTSTNGSSNRRFDFAKHPPWAFSIPFGQSLNVPCTNDLQ